MSENTATEFVKGTWQHSLNESAVIAERGEKAKKRASALLWQGAQAGVSGWLENGAASDAGAEGLYAEVLEILGTKRKGDASKIKTVAVAVKDHGLDLSTFPNLSQAYSEATRLTKTVKEEKEQDDAAEAVIESIDAPKTASTPESAALILLGKGVDGAVVAILDALNGPSGEHNEAAHRAFARALVTEISARVQAAKPKPEPKPAKEKAVAKATKTAAPKPAATKAKPKPAASDAPEVEVEEEVSEDVTPEVPAAPVKAKPVRRPVPKR